MQTIHSNKKAAATFLKMVIAGNIDEAFEEYINMQGQHHNAYTAAGFPALKEGMKDADIKFPNKQFTIQHIIGDENLVAVHSFLVLEKDKTELTVVHLFRFENEKIVEFWDLSQPVFADSPNKDGVF